MIEALLMAGGMMGARIKSMQRGLVTFLNGQSISQTISISPVNLQNTLFIFQVGTHSSNFRDVAVPSSVAENQITFTRGSYTDTVETSWIAIELEGIAAVHRREIVISSGFFNQVIDLTEVSDKAKCFVIPYVKSSYKSNEFSSVQMTVDMDAFTDNRIVLRRGDADINITVGLQIVEFL
ncbi:hypothetical protein [Roseovarius sp.]|uniref:hypothetical protein n=1 Tax=Roseovarius sp. TaxID=1486281 RepID=UPI003A985F7B